MSEITLDATVANIERVTTFVNDLLEQHNCSMKAQMQIAVAIDEIFCNISSYAYGDAGGLATVSVSFTDAPAAVICFSDEGIPYNPLEKEDPDTSLSAEQRQIGGLGIFMVKNLMDDMTYRRDGNKNILTITKKI